MKFKSYYKQAYLSLLDIRTHDANIFEIKTVAGQINYKLCRLLFNVKHPIDAIDQFRRHIDIFRNKIGLIDLAFEHSAWLSKQFEVMGEIFEDAIKKGYLNAVQTQHPGFYFHSASNQCLQRRAYFRQYSNQNMSSKQLNEDHDALNKLMNSLDFYGQRPWRQGSDISDQVKEREGILLLQEIEAKENFSVFIILFLVK